MSITLHPWLADLAAPIGSQEVVEHTHKWWQLIGQHMPVCRWGPQVSAGWVPSWQYYQELLPIAWFIYFFPAENDLYYLSYNIQPSSHATVHTLRPPVGSRCQFPKTHTLG